MRRNTVKAIRITYDGMLPNQCSKPIKVDAESQDIT